MESHIAQSDQEVMQDSDLNPVSESPPKTVHQQALDEPLTAGFAVLRVAQLINPDIYYVGCEFETSNAVTDKESERVRDRDVEAATTGSSRQLAAKNEQSDPPETYSTILDNLAELNPLQKYLTKSSVYSRLCRFAKICLSMFAVVICIDKTVSTVILCLVTKLEHHGGETMESTNSMVGFIVLFLVNISSLVILFSTIFNGHLLWRLFGQRLFLVSRSYQYKSMISLLIFTYFEYLINISFINNLYEWDFTSNDIKSERYSVFANLRILSTDTDMDHYLVDIILTLFQFARGVIRISPYITMNYAIICLRAHIEAIRGQKLLVDSLKRRQKLRLAITSRKQNGAANLGRLDKSQPVYSNGHVTAPVPRKKKVSFVMGESPTEAPKLRQLRVVSSITEEDREPESKSPPRLELSSSSSTDFLDRVRDFEQLESYITNLYIFSGQLNRLMSLQGLSVFFIVHNLVISVSVIVPEAIRGGAPMVHLIRALLVVIGMVPFVLGQSLNSQLCELSRQIDRIIIQRQFVHRRRDNLIRIRELIHDVKAKCGSMLSFNIETGVKYLVVAFASAFFIEQERK